MARRCRSCLTLAEPRKRLCQACGKKLPKPAKRRPKHTVALEQPYEVFVQANGGYDGCWMCRALGVLMGGVLQRDHWHNGPSSGEPRGILCIYHNKKLGPTYTPEFLRAALAYVERTRSP